MSPADQAGPPGRLTVSLLGPVDVYLDGTAAGLPQPAQRILLATLALSANRVVPVTALIEALWHEDASRQREKNLHVQVHLLRRRLAELEPGRTRSRIVTAPPGYLLELGPAELDVLTFGELARRGRQLARAGDAAAASDALGQALALWHGPALGEIAGASSVLAVEAAGLEDQRLAVLEDRADADLAAGRHAELTGPLGRLIAQHPLRERPRAQLMLALYRCGRTADALAAYQQAQAVLGDELGLDPGPELQARQRQILAADPLLRWSAGPARTSGSSAAGTGVGDSGRADSDGADSDPAGAGDPTTGDPTTGDPTTGDPGTGDPGTGAQDEAPVVPRQLPAGVRHFAGRDAELAELTSLLPDPDATGIAKVALITGTAGAGKTALALHWAHQVAASFPDGQLHVNLRGFDPSGTPLSPAEAIRGLLHGLGVARSQLPDSADDQAGLYRSLLAGRRVLVVLDNAREAGQVLPLLPDGAGCLALITSRSDLSGLAAAASVAPVPLGLLGHPEAAALLAARLGPVRAAAEPGAAGQIIRLCAGLPLALAIAAARAAARPELPLTVLADELAAEPDLLDALDTGDQATSLRAVFSWSYRQLPAAGARLFRLLAEHPGPDFSAAAVASLAGLPPPRAGRILAELVAASLVTEHGQSRFVLHDLLRAYAAELEPDPGPAAGERAAARARLIDHYLHTAHAATLLLAPIGHPIVLARPAAGVRPEPISDREEALSWFRAELKVLLAAVSLAAAAGLDRQAWQLPWTLRSFLDGQGLWPDWDAVNQIALVAAERRQDHDGLGWTHHRMAQVCSLSGATQDGIAHNQQAFAHFGLAGNAAGQGAALLGTCISLGRQGQHADALQAGEQALELFRATGDQLGQAYMLHLVGLELAQLGHPDQGQEQCMQAVELYGQLGDIGGLADAWHSLGTLHKQAGEHADAIACFHQSLMLSAELGDRWGQAYCLIYAGDTHDDAGDLPAARQSWQQALELLGDAQHPAADRIRVRLAETTGPAVGQATAAPAPDAAGHSTLAS